MVKTNNYDYVRNVFYFPIIPLLLKIKQYICVHKKRDNKRDCGKFEIVIKMKQVVKKKHK